MQVFESGPNASPARCMQRTTGKRLTLQQIHVMPYATVVWSGQAQRVNITRHLLQSLGIPSRNQAPADEGEGAHQPANAKSCTMLVPCASSAGRNTFRPVSVWNSSIAVTRCHGTSKSRAKFATTGVMYDALCSCYMLDVCGENRTDRGDM